MSISTFGLVQKISLMVDQTLFGNKNGNCFSACVASILDLALEDVPNFCAQPNKNWYRDFVDWCKTQELVARYSTNDPQVLCIASGPSYRGSWLHAVVWDRGMVHDPHPSRLGLAGPPVDFIYMLRTQKIKKPFTLLGHKVVISQDAPPGEVGLYISGNLVGKPVEISGEL